MAGEVTIQREIEIMSEELNKLTQATKNSNKELRDIQKNLRLDPKNTELLAEKQNILSEQLENAKSRSEELRNQIELLNSEKAKTVYTDEQIINRTAELNEQLRKTEREITALTGATQNQSQALQEAEDSTKSFSQSMTEFQSNLRAVNQVVSGVDSTFRMLGGDSNSAMGQMIQQGKQAVQMMTGIASMGKILGKSNTDLAKTFSTVAMAAGAAVAAYSIGTSVIDLFGEENRKTAGIIAIVTGALGAMAIAGLAAAGALSWGTAVPIIMASVGVGVAGLTAMLSDSTADIKSSATALKAGTSAPSASTPSAPSAPTVPAYSGGGSSQSQMVIQTLSEKQIENAAYSGITRAIIETGLNNKEFVGTGEINGRELVRWIFNDILKENTERNNPLKVR